MPTLKYKDPVSGLWVPLVFGNQVSSGGGAAAPVGFSAYIGTTHSLPVSGFNGITGWTEDYDTNNAFNPATGLYVVPVTGLYAISASLLFNTNTTGRRFIQIEKGTASPGANPGLIRQEVDPNGFLGLTVYREVTITAGSTLRLVAYQTSGGALNALGGDSATSFNARKVG